MNGRRFDDHDVVDVVIVGTGAGGAPLLAELARSGLKVVALEAGPRFDPRQHTPDEATASEIYWLEERLSGGANPMAFGGNNSGTGVGGSMLHFGAFMPRIDARDMRLHSETGKGVDWPFDFETLLPISSGSSVKSESPGPKTTLGTPSVATPIRRRSAMAPRRQWRAVAIHSAFAMPTARLHSSPVTGAIAKPVSAVVPVIRGAATARNRART